MILFLINRNLVHRTQSVLNSVCGGADPHTPAQFCSPKIEEKGAAAALVRVYKVFPYPY